VRSARRSMLAVRRRGELLDMTRPSVSKRAGHTRS
jgi:hypothetical protein